MKPGTDYIGVGVFALIENPMGELLLSKSVPSEKRLKEYERVWAMIGGTIKFAETAEQSLLREVNEETGLAIRIRAFLGYNDYIKEGKHWIGLNFYATTQARNFVNVEPDKQADIQWFRASEIPSNLSEYTRSSLLRLNHLTGKIQ